jgi:two-component system sensor histidine kinase KdpD
MDVEGIRRRWAGIPRVRRAVVAVLAGLALATLVVGVLETVVPSLSAAPIYLLAVLSAGLLAGTIPAVVTAVASFLVYDFLFVAPYYTLTISDPEEWLNLLLLLAVALVIGRLAAIQAEHAEEVAERAREAEDLFAMSRSLATTQNLAEAADAVLARLRVSGAMDRTWLGLGPSPAEERIVADTARGTPLPVPGWQVVLQRTPGDEPARWTRTHVGAGGRRRDAAASVYRIRVEVPGEQLGSLWGLRARNEREPDRAETRILAAAADQLGQAARRDRLIADALEAEVARRSEALMTALLDSVSHDLRTPLATIRAAAGSMLDASVSWTPEERADALRAIDGEAERMNRLVRNLLDLSRIEGGALHPELEPHDLDEFLGSIVRRLAIAKTVEVVVPDDLPPLLVDSTYLDEVLTNLIENAGRYGGPTVRISAAELDPATVEIVIEDDGPGVPEADRPHLFDKFFRVRRAGEGSRRGMGIGLTVARGLARAMGGDISADQSELGGLAMRVRVPSDRLPLDRPADLASSGDRAPSGEARPTGAPS